MKGCSKKMRNVSLIFLAMILPILFVNVGHADKDQKQPDGQTKGVKDIGVEEANQMIRNGQNQGNLVIIDVRTPEEFNQEHIENASNIDFYSDNFKAELNKLDKNKTYVIHCQSGGRSSRALEIMRELGFREAYNMGGIIEWKENGFPTTR